MTVEDVWPLLNP